MGERFDGVVFTHVQNSGDAAKRTESSRLVSPIENSQLTTIRRTLLSAAVKNIAAIIIIIVESWQKKVDSCFRTSPSFNSLFLPYIYYYYFTLFFSHSELARNGSGGLENFFLKYLHHCLKTQV